MASSGLRDRCPTRPPLRPFAALTLVEALRLHRGHTFLQAVLALPPPLDCARCIYLGRVRAYARCASKCLPSLARTRREAAATCRDAGALPSGPAEEPALRAGDDAISAFAPCNHSPRAHSAPRCRPLGQSGWFPLRIPHRVGWQGACERLIRHVWWGFCLWGESKAACRR